MVISLIRLTKLHLFEGVHLGIVVRNLEHAQRCAQAERIDVSLHNAAATEQRLDGLQQVKDAADFLVLQGIVRKVLHVFQRKLHARSHLRLRRKVVRNARR